MKTAFPLSLTLAAALGLSGCAWYTVAPADRDAVNAKVHAGMRMDEARGELEAMDYVCQSREGAYVDEYGNEHTVDSPFVSCDHRPGSVSFVCNTRTQVLLIPNGDRVQSVQISKAPSCIKQ